MNYKKTRKRIELYINMKYKHTSTLHYTFTHKYTPNKSKINKTTKL